MAARKSSHPVLRMPLDLSVPVDLEVYRILYDFKSAVACKNFLLSAVLYYSRSPLVLSANALTEVLDRMSVQDSTEKIMGRLEDIFKLLRNGSRFIESAGIADDAGVAESGATGIVAGGEDQKLLLSLKSRFKI
jgi:hypothetical protein